MRVLDVQGGLAGPAFVRVVRDPMHRARGLDNPQRRRVGGKRLTVEGFMVGTLAEAKELMALARGGKIKPTPMREEPMADVQKWIDELRAGRVVGRIMLKN